MTWTCHAHPVELGGKPCGHVNQGDPVRHGPFKVECCQRCGCTRLASEARENKSRIGLDTL